MLETGQTYAYSFSFSQADVARFAQLTGDHNPLHLDADYAAKTAFKKPIIHGLLGSSIFSKVLGTINPGEGSLYLKQTLEFVNPLFVDVPYDAVFTVLEILPNSIARIQTEVVDQTTRAVMITGEAHVRNKAQIKRVRAGVGA